MPTIRDVASRAGVSVGLASAVLNQAASVSADARARVLDAVRALDYVPHSGARDLRLGQRRQIGLMLPDITNPHFAGLAHAIGLACERAGYALTLSITGDDPAREIRALVALRAGRTAGTILVPGGDTETDASRVVAAVHGPVVLLDRLLPGLAADTVLLDNREAASLLTEHLFALGHRRIGLVGGPTSIALARERQEGFAAAHAAHGVRRSAALAVSTAFQPGPAEAATLTLLDRPRPPTALVSTSNHVTIGVMRALSRRGLRCPDDLSVAAIDDLPGADGFAPGLTVAAQPIEAMGEDAVRLLLDRIGGARDGAPCHVVHAPVPRWRGSTAPPRGQ